MKLADKENQTLKSLLRIVTMQRDSNFQIIKQLKEEVQRLESRLNQ